MLRAILMVLGFKFEIRFGECFFILVNHCTVYMQTESWINKMRLQRHTSLHSCISILFSLNKELLYIKECMPRFRLYVRSGAAMPSTQTHSQSVPGKDVGQNTEQSAINLLIPVTQCFTTPSVVGCAL